MQPKVFNEQFAPHLKQDVTIVVASGYNVYFKLLKFSPGQDVVMVAPRYAQSYFILFEDVIDSCHRMIGSSVRSLYQTGVGYPCFVSVEQDGSGIALETALGLARAIGATKGGAITSSAREETALDLFAGK